jgi:hypothetical protein
MLTRIFSMKIEGVTWEQIKLHNEKRSNLYSPSNIIRMACLFYCWTINMRSLDTNINNIKFIGLEVNHVVYCTALLSSSHPFLLLDAFSAYIQSCFPFDPAYRFCTLVFTYFWWCLLFVLAFVLSLFMSSCECMSCFFGAVCSAYLVLALEGVIYRSVMTPKPRGLGRNIRYTWA